LVYKQAEQYQRPFLIRDGTSRPLTLTLPLFIRARTSFKLAGVTLIAYLTP